MTSRALARVFRPAVALLGRLRYAQKFVLVGLVLLVPLGFVATAYVQSQRSQIAFSAKERQGVAYLAPLIELTAHAVQARHVAVSGGGTTDSRVDLDRNIDLVNSLDRRVGAALNTARDWPLARGRLESARRADGPATARYDAYNAAVDALLALIVHVGDESNLTLDPDLDTYYLMDTLQFRLPVLLDTAGRSVDRAALGADGSPGGGRTDGLIQIGLAGGVLTSTRTVITRAVATIGATTADPEVQRSTAARFARLDTASTALEETLTAAVKTGRLDVVEAHSADTVRAAAADFAARIAVSLDRLLRVRIDGFSARAHRVELAAGLAALLGGYLFVGFYLSVTPSIRRIVATLHAVADGDLTRRVTVDTHDELSFVARALNDTIATTEVASNRLARQATHDTLTGLPNRALVLDRLAQALAHATSSRDLVCVLFIDLDRFKPINDSLGHEAGDEVLRRIAARLTALVGTGDTVARLAGDEFVVVGEKLTGPSAAVRMAEEIVAELSRPIMTGIGIAARDVSVGASVGVAFAGVDGPAGTPGLTPEDLLRDADVAMYRAKQRGRGRVEVFDDALRVAVQHRLETHDDLRHGIDSGHIRVHYQPIVDGATGRILGFEALARWQHPVRGLLGPADFIEVAEESGLIVPLGADVLAQACAQAARWRADQPDQPDLYVAVNVSAAQFTSSSFVSGVGTVLAETGLDPDALWLEITETSIMADAEAAAETLRAIRALGVHLAIDDFGTGYSSLTYLRRFPVDALKIDRAFVAGIGRDHEDDAIVDMILSLARALGLRVVAEGVETADQRAHLRRLGCDAMQGYLLGRPAPADQAGSLLPARLPRGHRRAVVASESA